VTRGGGLRAELVSGAGTGGAGSDSELRAQLARTTAALERQRERLRLYAVSNFNKVRRVRAHAKDRRGAALVHEAACCHAPAQTDLLCPVRTLRCLCARRSQSTSRKAFDGWRFALLLVRAAGPTV